MTNPPSRLTFLPEAHGARTDGLAAALGPDFLLAHRDTSPRSIDHPARLGNDANVVDFATAVAAVGPEDQVTGLGLAARDAAAELGIVLSLGSASC